MVNTVTIGIMWLLEIWCSIKGQVATTINIEEPRINTAKGIAMCIISISITLSNCCYCCCVLGNINTG